MSNPLFTFTLIAFGFLCAIFILLILIQKGRGGGISSAFGGAGGNTAFGSKTGDVLTWATSVVFGIFLLMCVALNYMATDINATARGIKPVSSNEGGSTAVPTPSTDPTASEPTPGSTPSTPAPGDVVPTMPDVSMPATQPGTN